MGPRNSVTYMSPQIQNEFIGILGDIVRQQIMCQVQKAKYYSSILFDSISSPDISHNDQTSQVVRYVKIENQEVEVVESFIDFIETKNKTAEAISDMILSKLKADGLDIMDCRGQTYDNAAVMAGKHTGVQQRFKDINPNAEFVPCSNHSLNLVCLHAASIETNSVTFFGTLERCYAFFSMSTHRWDVLIAAIGKTLKTIQDTRWSARAEAVDIAWNHYKLILTALEKLTEASEKDTNTRRNCVSRNGIIFFFMSLGPLEPVLHEVNDVQIYLQTQVFNVHQCDKNKCFAGTAHRETK
ncbi:uncharacterized protein LOC118192706 [Stegodyphus dumicola]|uniref:uncharacterized protein LOC118192706 n=1 Tax=Stegodyphus dumicola TaxID=202533 RepID=UPI0015ADE190|nr:uncharacterized protein LOC118192706 [Stegodyphus dumicola]